MKQLIKSELFLYCKHRLTIGLIAILLCIFGYSLFTMNQAHEEYIEWQQFQYEMFSTDSDREIETYVSKLRRIEEALYKDKDESAKADVELVNTQIEYTRGLKNAFGEVVNTYETGSKEDFNNNMIALNKMRLKGMEKGYETFDKFFESNTVEALSNDIEMGNEIVKRDVEAYFSPYEINVWNYIMYLCTDRYLYIVCFALIFYCSKVFADTDNNEAYKSLYIMPYSRMTINAVKIICAVIIGVTMTVLALVATCIFIMMAFELGDLNYPIHVLSSHFAESIGSIIDIASMQFAGLIVISIFSILFGLMISMISDSPTVAITIGLIVICLFYFGLLNVPFIQFFPYYYLNFIWIINGSANFHIMLGSTVFFIAVFTIVTLYYGNRKDMLGVKL